MSTTTISPPAFRHAASRVRERWEESHRMNVGMTERIISAAAGALAAGYGISRRDPLGYALAGVGGWLIYRGASGHSFMMRALGVSTAGEEWLQLAPKHGEAARPDHGKAVHVRDEVTIDRPVADIYNFWRDFTNLPRVMPHLISVERIDGGRSHWKSRGPAGLTAEWDAVVESDVPNELIAWESVEPASVPNGGSVRFHPAPGGRGTEVCVALHYQPPAGHVGHWAAKLFGEEPGQHLREGLRHIKQVLETGEIATNEPQPHGRR